MKYRSLSGFVRDYTNLKYDGPIPQEDRKWVDSILCAERLRDKTIGAYASGMNALAESYRDFMEETARLEAFTELAREKDATPKTHDKQRTALLLSISAGKRLAENIAKLTEILEGQVGKEKEAA